MKNKALEELIIAFSMANLLFITSWRKLLYPSSESYHVKLEPYSLDYAGILISVSLVALILFGGWRLFRYLNKDETPLISKLIFLGATVTIINGIRLQFFQSDSNIYLKIGFFLTIAVAGVFLFFKWRNQLLKVIKTVFLILSPFVLITFSQAIWGLINANPQPEVPFADQLANIQLKEKTKIKSRVVWIIFDEMDYFVPFGKNPAPVELPAFNRLKNESLFATNATSPAYDTLESIPALLMGKPLEKSVPDGKNELKLNFKNKQVENFSETETIFRKVKEMNGETAIIGWYHPYCRVIGKDLSACYWESFDTLNDFAKQSLWKIILINVEKTLISLPFGFRLYQTIKTKTEANIIDNDYVKRHRRMIEESEKAVASPNLDLVLIHFPFPHSPYYYDGVSKEFTQNQTSYVDNLILSNDMLEKLRNDLERQNLWNDSTIIVSSDHQWRLNEYKVSPENVNFTASQGIEHPNIPFFLKLKNQKDPLIYDKPFNTVISHDLILAIMKGELSTKEDAANWIDKNSTR